MRTIMCYGDSNTWGAEPGTGERFAEQYDCRFLDASAVISSSDIDGIHFEAAEHRKLGGAVATRIREVFA